MIASYHEADSEKDMSIKKEKITEIEEYLSKQNPKKNLSEELSTLEKNYLTVNAYVFDFSDELYNQTFSAHIIKLDLENNSKANTQSNSNDNVGTTFNLSHGEECIQKDVLQEINHSGIKKKANSSYDEHLNTSKNFVLKSSLYDSNSSAQLNNNSVNNNNEGENAFQ